MKNVYNDYKIENDTVEAAEAAQQENPLPQFQTREEKPKPVSYDEKGYVREDKTFRRMKFVGLFLFVALVQFYVAHTCAAQMGMIQ